MSEPTFIQLIEFQSQRIDEIERAVDDWAREIGARRTAVRVTTSADRDMPQTYLQLVEFPDYEQAMANSDDPTTAYFARKLRELCDGEPKFRNLTVTRRVTF